MPHVDVTLPQDWAAVAVGAQAAEVAVPGSSVSVLAAAPSVEVVIPESVVSVICDDDLDSSFTTPTLTDWSVLAGGGLAVFGLLWFWRRTLTRSVPDSRAWRA